MEKSASFVSVVGVASSSASFSAASLREIHQVLQRNYADFEIVIIAQPGAINAIESIGQQLGQLTAVRLLKLATPVAHDVALSAGLENAIGDFVVLLTPGTDPTGVIVDVVERCRSGADIVIGVAEQRASWFYRLLRPWATKLVRTIGYDVPKDATQLRCLSRRTVNAVMQAGRFHHQLFVRMQKTGYPWTTYPYAQLAAAPQRTLRSAVRETLRLLVFNSTRPLRWLTGGGMAIASLSTLIGASRTVAALLNDARWSGADIALTMGSLLALVLLAAIGFLGEYVARLLDERTEQFCYAIASERNSSVMLDENRVNVLADSLVYESRALDNAPH